MSARDEILNELDQWSSAQEKVENRAMLDQYRAEVLAQVGRHLVEIYGASGKYITPEPLGVNIGKWLQRGALWEQ